VTWRQILEAIDELTRERQEGERGRFWGAQSSDSAGASMAAKKTTR
jgi:hypothetical protein